MEDLHAPWLYGLLIILTYNYSVLSNARKYKNAMYLYLQYKNVNKLIKFCMYILM